MMKTNILKKMQMLITLSALLFVSGAFSQDIKKADELFIAGEQAVKDGNTELAIQNFEQSLEMASKLGNPIGSFYGFKILDIFQSQAEINHYKVTDDNGVVTLIQPNARPGDFRFADLNGDGKINANDRTFIGDPTPTWSYGGSISATYKGFDILAFGQGVAGNDVYNGLRRLDIPNANWTTEAMGRWTGEGTSTTFPRLTTNDANKNFSSPSNFYLTSGAYFRIKTLQIGYTLPKTAVEKIGLQQLRIYLSSNNLATFTKYNGFDPEIGGYSYGIDRGIYPQARSFMAGLSVTF